MKIRWKFGELKWNHSNVRALLKQTNKQTDTETDADEISTAIRFAAVKKVIEENGGFLLGTLGYGLCHQIQHLLGTHPTHNSKTWKVVGMTKTDRKSVGLVLNLL